MDEMLNDIVEQSEPISDPIFGVVANCKLLNVREAPDKNSEILTTIGQGDEIMIDIDASTDDFYSVCTETGVEGYCMRQFIEV